MGERIIVKYVLQHTVGTKPMEKGEAYAKTFNEAEIHKRAMADPDAQPLTKEQLAKFRPVNPFYKKR